MLRSLKYGRNFENMEKNKWILRRSDLSKESFYELYMTPQDNLSPNLEHLSKWNFCSQKKMIQLAANRVLPVELSSGNKLHFWKEKYLRYTTHQNLDSYG